MSITQWKKVLSIARTSTRQCLESTCRHKIGVCGIRGERSVCVVLGVKGG